MKNISKTDPIGLTKFLKAKLGSAGVIVANLIYIAIVIGLIALAGPAAVDMLANVS